MKCRISEVRPNHWNRIFLDLSLSCWVTLALTSVYAPSALVFSAFILYTPLSVVEPSIRYCSRFIYTQVWLVWCFESWTTSIFSPVFPLNFTRSVPNPNLPSLFLKPTRCLAWPAIPPIHLGKILLWMKWVLYPCCKAQSTDLLYFLKVLWLLFCLHLKLCFSDWLCTYLMESKSCFTCIHWYFTLESKVESR